MNVLHMQRMFCCWKTRKRRFFFWFRAACKLWLARYGPKHASRSLSDTPLYVYFKCYSKTMGCLQLYCTPNDSSTIEDDLFCVKSGEAAATNKLLGLRQTLLSCCFVHKYEWQQHWGCLWLYYNTVTTAFLPGFHVIEILPEVRLMSWGAVQRLSWCLHYT